MAKYLSCQRRDRHRRRKGQVSTEYLMVISFSLLILIPTIIISVNYSQDYQNRVKAQELKKAADEITSSADSVYFQGPPALNTLKIYLPTDITKVYAIGNVLIFTVGSGPASYNVTSKAQYANLTWNAQIGGEGNYNLAVQATGSNVTISTAG